MDDLAFLWECYNEDKIAEGRLVMRISDMPEIATLSIPEKILLVEDLWDKIVLNEPKIPVPQSHKKELSKRLRRYKTTPGNLLSLKELRTRIEKKK
jgi:putative addiction module component (TIGR02574 family)